MTKRERIAKLESEVADLRQRLVSIEARGCAGPWAVPYQPYVPTPTYPSFPQITWTSGYSDTTGVKQ